MCVIFCFILDIQRPPIECTLLDFGNTLLVHSTVDYSVPSFRFYANYSFLPQLCTSRKESKKAMIDPRRRNVVYPKGWISNFSFLAIGFRMLHFNPSLVLSGPASGLLRQLALLVLWERRLYLRTFYTCMASSLWPLHDLTIGTRHSQVSWDVPAYPHEVLWKSIIFILLRSAEVDDLLKDVLAIDALDVLGEVAFSYLTCSASPDCLVRHVLV